MSHIEKSRLASDLAAISTAFTTNQFVLLSGAPGSGKSFLLQKYASQLATTQTSVVQITESLPALPTLDSGAVLCIKEIDRLPHDMLLSIIEAGTQHRILATLSTGAVISPRTNVAQHPSQASSFTDSFTKAHSILVTPYSDLEIGVLIHSQSEVPLDTLTHSRLVELSWGRPGWAIRLLEALNTHPDLQLQLHKPVLDSVLTQNFSQLIQVSRASLDALNAETIADAIVLAEIGPRSYNGVIDLIGVANARSLITAGLLEPAPNELDQWGVPLVYTPMLIASSQHEALGSSYHQIVQRLLAQEQLGLPLSESEERVCSFALMSVDHFTNVAVPLPQNQQNLLLRRMRRLLCFGQAEPAKDILLRLGRNGTALCQITKARLITLIQDGHAGLQTLLFPTQQTTNCVLPINDNDYRLGLLLLRARLASTTGTTYVVDDEALPEDPAWQDTFDVIRAWNQPESLSISTKRLQQISELHPDTLVQLLAESLFELDHHSNGKHTDTFNADRFVQRLTEAFRAYAERPLAEPNLDDAFTAVIVAYHLTALFNPSPLPHLELTAQLTQRLSGDYEHMNWVRHLAAAKEALHCGDVVRFELELKKFDAALPRFLPQRFQWYIQQFFHSVTGGQAHLGDTFASQLTCYFSGDFSGISLLPKVTATLSAEVLSTEPALNSIGFHISATTARNPAALRRASHRLSDLQLWGPARRALEDAASIYTSRRASGKSAEVEAELTALSQRMQREVVWLEPVRNEKSVLSLLTQREIETARQVADGLSNLEIAAALHCSVRTVESHISNARAKLGAKNRVELAQQLKASDEIRFQTA